MSSNRRQLGRSRLWWVGLLAVFVVGLVAVYQFFALPHDLNGPEFDDYLALVSELGDALRCLKVEQLAE